MQKVRFMLHTIFSVLFQAGKIIFFLILVAMFIINLMETPKLWKEWKRRKKEGD